MYSTRGIPARTTERGGFEPPMDGNAHTGFRDRRIQPLCHLSRWGAYKGSSARSRRVGAGEGPRPHAGAGSAPGGEERAQQRAALLGQQARPDLWSVVELGLGQHVQHAADGARLGV
jgi:hypothetical protein